MRTRTFIPLFIALVVMLPGCGQSAKPAGPPLATQMTAQITSSPSFGYLKSHHFYSVGDVAVGPAQMHFVTLDGTQPRYLDRARKALEVLQSIPNPSTYQSNFADPTLTSVNPFTIKVELRPQPMRYAVLTDDDKILKHLDKIFGASNASSHTGGTDSKLPDYVVTALYTKAKANGEFKDYFSKTIVTEMCQSTLKATPTRDTVDRGFKNANPTGTAYSRDRVQRTLESISQELYCNSFGLMAYYAQHGKSFKDYSDYAGQSGISIFGSPGFIVFDESIYRSVA